MSHEQEDIQRLIRQARRAGPEEDALARVWQRLDAPPPAGPEGEAIDVPDPAALADATQALAGKAAFAAGLKTIAAAAVIGAAIVGGRWIAGEKPDAAATEVARPETVATEVVGTQGIEAAPAETEVAASEPVPALTTKSAGRRNAGTPGAAGVDPGAERRLIEAAQASLQSGETGAALTSLDEHARRFARGLLADEREVLRVLALCAERREAEAETAAQKLLAASGAGLFLPRLQGSCVGERLVPVQRPGRGE